MFCLSDSLGKKMSTNLYWHTKDMRREQREKRKDEKHLLPVKFLEIYTASMLP